MPTYLPAINPLLLSSLNCSFPPAKCPAQELRQAEMNSPHRLPTLTFETDVLAKFFLLTTRARRNDLQTVEESPPVRQSALEITMTPLANKSALALTKGFPGFLVSL